MLVDQPAKPESFHEVRTFQDLLAAVNSEGPREIRFEADIEASEVVIIGGFTGNDSATKGHDITFDMNGFTLSKYGFNVERGCERLRFQNGTIANGADFLPKVQDIPKSEMPDAFQITGHSSLDRAPARNITVSQVSALWGTDIPFNSEGDRVWLDRCLVTRGLATPKHIKSPFPHSKAVNIRNQSTERITAYITQSVMAMSYDRGPRAAGNVDLHFHDSISAGVYMGFVLEDAHDGFLRVNGTGNMFVNGKCWRVADQRKLPGFAATFYLQDPRNQIYFGNNQVNGEPANLWEKARYPRGVPNTDINMTEPTITSDYSPMSETSKYSRVLAGAGNPFDCELTRSERESIGKLGKSPGLLYRVFESESEAGL